MTIDYGSQNDLVSKESSVNKPWTLDWNHQIARKQKLVLKNFASCDKFFLTKPPLLIVSVDGP